MLCPKCNKEIKYVNVISQCWGKGHLLEDTNEITDYALEEIEKTLFIECPECQERITEGVKEN